MDFSPMQILFLVTASVLVIAAVLTVTTRNLVHAALWMVLSFFGVAILFVLLGTGFFAVIQVVVYIGAIAVLILFVIMLTNPEILEQKLPKRGMWWTGILTLFTFFLMLVMVIQALPIHQTILSVPNDEGMVKALGKALVEPGQFGLVFELASILLLVALIGAIYLAQDRPSRQGGSL